MSKRAADKHWSGYSSAYFNKLVKKEQEIFLQIVRSDDNLNSPTHDETIVQFNGVDGPSVTTSHSTNPISDSSEEDLSDLDEHFYDEYFAFSDEEGFSSHISEVEDDNPLARDLASFVVRRRVCNRATDDLLRVLNKYNVRVPKTHQNLTKTPKEKINVRKIVGGSYYYRGIAKALEERAHLLKDLNHIVLDIGIDGASLFHSSHLQIWPSAGSIVDDVTVRPFLIAKTYYKAVPMEKNYRTNFNSASLCSTSKKITNKSVASESLKNSNTTIKTPSFFVTLNKTPNGYVIANNNIHAQKQHSQNLSTSTVNQKKNLHAHQANSPVQREEFKSLVNGHGSRYLNETSNHSRKENILHQPQHRNVVTAKKSTMKTALVSEIRSELNFGNGSYCLPNGKSMTSAYKQPYMKPASVRPALVPTSIKPIVNSTVTGHTTSIPFPSSLTKFNFPLPPKKNDFKIVTKTQFATAVDSQLTPKAVPCHSQSEPVSSQSARSSLEFLSNGVPSDCQSFRKIKINVNHSTPVVENAEVSQGDTVPASRHVPRLIPKPAAISTSLFDDDSSLHEELGGTPATVPSSLFDDDSSLHEELGGRDDYESLARTSSTSVQNANIDDLTKRVQNVEKGLIASAKQGSEVLIAVKKMAKNLSRFVKYADDNSDEIRKLLPIKRHENLIRFDQRIIDDTDFRKRVLLYLRGFKGTGVPDHFSSVLRIIMVDDLIYDFNFSGVMGKHSLANFKFLDVIHDLYKPMDDDSFDAKIRKTLTIAKNRKNASNFRKRRLDQ